MKLLILLVIALAVVVWFKRAKNALTSASAPEPDQTRQNPFARRQRREQAEVMVPCAHCGIHVPASEALRNSGGVSFCCEEHLRLTSP